MRRTYKKADVPFGIIAILVAITELGCGAVPKLRHVENSRTYSASFDKTWSAAIAMFAENFWPIEMIEKESGLISSGWFPDQEGLGDYGKAGMGARIDLGSGQVKLNIVVVSRGDSTSSVTVNNRFKAKWWLSGFPRWQDGTSRGMLEKRILGYIQIKVTGLGSSQ